MLEEDIKQELVQLKEFHLLPSDFQSSDLVQGIYNHPLWPLFFWRRRISHQQRPDPEIPYVIKLNPRNVLEVGSAYGRFSQKLLHAFKQEGVETDLFGIEVNPHFKGFAEKFASDNPELSAVKTTFDDIVNAPLHFKQNFFDCIVVPMHTLPGMSPEFIEKSLEVIKSILAPNGHLVFSYNKHFSFDKHKNISRMPRVSGELIPELGQEPVGSVAYDFPEKDTMVGYSRVGYRIFYRFDRQMKPIESSVARTEYHMIEPSHLEALLTNNHFKINDLAEEQFSYIYTVSPDRSA